MGFELQESYSYLEAFSHNPKLGSFMPLAFQSSAMTNYVNQWFSHARLNYYYDTAIRKADIEGSKSNVAMNTWLPQASYPCVNFFDTSSFKFQMIDRPYVLPQPIYPPNIVFYPDQSSKGSHLSYTSQVIHKVGLESSLTRSYFPVDSTKPIPLAMVSLDKHWVEITLREHP
ncbi:uncharacterized protein LOC111302006 [Durio zibethinus]|uniref:Uncharacterized protein LOC111302006 n=1 Tax=Durio zibethinus TaxID=66656 RepID=A0A6P5ZLI9_DURZI|nr:uncharacterized protein LOC111302006 [Durio zibethinus]